MTALPRINFITNYALEDIGGGWNSISANSYLSLRNHFDVHYVGPIFPPPLFVERLWSKARRTVGFTGSVPFFSPARLDRIARAYQSLRLPDAECDHFHGATPWVRCRPRGRYSVYIDATFAQYMQHYSTPSQFTSRDLCRIEEEERAFLYNADVVFFGSEWVRDDAVSRYRLDPGKTFVAYVAGNVSMPDADVYEGGLRFLFISLDFERKGGRLAVDALQRVRQSGFDEAELVIVGQSPPPEIASMPGIVPVGLLRKSDPEEHRRLSEYFSKSRALIHPTSQDTMGLVLIEAAYHGCPAVTSRSFGVPEYVLDGETGCLLDPPLSSAAVAGAMMRLCSDEESYLAMRSKAFERAHRDLTWDAFGERLKSGMRATGLVSENARGIGA